MLIHVIVNKINLDSKEYPIHMQGVCVSEHEAEGRASRAEPGRLIPRTSVTDSRAPCPWFVRASRKGQV